MMDIQEILRTLPHRYPIILVDRVVQVEPGRRIVALKNVSINEPVFAGHFPGYPVMPGVLILESLAQAAAILSIVTMAPEKSRDLVYYFVGIDKARFKRPVEPGDQLQLEVDYVRELRGIYFFKTKATVQGQVACEAELMCAYRAPPKTTGAPPSDSGP
jgi:3-hydroxyacyl-[acyl-carrier-protein] dehydratase